MEYLFIQVVRTRTRVRSYDRCFSTCKYGILLFIHTSGTYAYTRVHVFVATPYDRCFSTCKYGIFVHTSGTYAYTYMCS